MWSDPIADMLTRIRNAGHAGHRRVDMPVSKLKIEIGRILTENHFIHGYKVLDDGRHYLRATRANFDIIISEPSNPWMSGPARLFTSHNPDYPDGGQMRDFVWVGDCVEVILWLLENEGVNGLYNCGSGHARTFEDVARAVFAALGREPEIEFIPMPDAIRDCYQYFTEADMGRLSGAGYAKPFTSLEDGVGRYVSGYLDAPDPYV